MSKKIAVLLTVEEIKTLIDALSVDPKNYLGNLFNKLDEIHDLNQEPHELTREEWHEKYGCEE